MTSLACPRVPLAMLLLPDVLPLVTLDAAGATSRAEATAPLHSTKIAYPPPPAVRLTVTELVPEDGDWLYQIAPFTVAPLLVKTVGTFPAVNPAGVPLKVLPPEFSVNARRTSVSDVLTLFSVTVPVPPEIEAFAD